MKSTVKFALSLLTAAAAIAAAAAELRVCTYNVRTADFDDRDPAPWSARSGCVARAIEATASDLIGLQEVIARQRVTLDRDLGEAYASAGVCRDDGAEKGESSPEALSKAFGEPAFPQGARPTVVSEADKVVLAIPAAEANPTSRAYAYDIAVVGEGGKAAAFRTCVYASGCDYAEDHPAAREPTRVTISRSRLPAGERLVYAVRPVSSLGRVGPAVSCS